MTRVLLVDDDPRLGALVSAGLAESGLECEVAGDGRSALARLQDPQRNAFDAVILDVMLPDVTGWDLLVELRAAGVTAPVIFVTARDAVDERVRGLRLGADDYLIKPFAFAELVARVESVIRRRREQQSLRLDTLELDLTRRVVRVADTSLDLAPKEFDLLRALVQARGRTLSRQQLLRDVWQLEADPGTNVLEVHVARLRRKLDRMHGPSIRTVRGQGYSVASAS